MRSDGTKGKPALSVIEGRADAPVRIALSLVHPRGRVDIPPDEVLEIEAKAEQTFFFSDTWTSKTYPMPHVHLSFTPRIGTLIHRLTSQIVGEPLDIVVAGKVIISPVIREPHGLRESMCIGFCDLEDAIELAAKLCEGRRPNVICAPVS
jgi:preprotein translocase subunit SecD